METKGLTQLAEALERGGIHRDLRGTTRDHVLCEVCNLPGIPRGVDRKLLQKLLMEREDLASTGTGGGIAIPHPRDPLVVGGAAASAFLCFLPRPIEFHSLDGRPVNVLCMILSPSHKAHLQLLRSLAIALHDDEFCDLLTKQASGEAILARARDLRC